MSFSAPFWSPSQASAILFDWDGIIAETNLDFSAVHRKYYGARRAMLLEDSSTLDEERRRSLMQDLETLEVEGAKRARPVPGIENVLDFVETRRIPWAVVSRNCRKSVSIASRRIGIPLPPISVTRDEGKFVKPDPRALFAVCETLGALPSETLFVGDYLYDMIGARRSGMRGVLVRARIEADWEPWLEYHRTDMAGFYEDLLFPPEIVAWEYGDTLERYGRNFLLSTAKEAVRVPPDAAPDLPTWLLVASSLGVSAFVAPEGTLCPALWKHNQPLEPSGMGLPLADALGAFLRPRYPLVRVLRPESSVRGLPAPASSAELAPFFASRADGI